jgi:hypothetical protein
VSRGLQDLDRRFIAAAAPRLRRLVDRLHSPELRRPDLTNLGALDARWANRGALGFFREVPQLMGVLIGIVFVAGTLAALVQHGSSSSAQQTVVDGGGAAPDEPASTTLGPAVGDSVTSYLATAANGLGAATRHAADRPRLALVSLTGYQTPAQLGHLLAGYPVQQVWLRDPLAGPDASQLPLAVGRDLLADLRSAYARTAATEAISQAKYQMLADTTEAGDPYKPFYRHYAQLAAQQARAYRQDCACVFAALVAATPAQLDILRGRRGVRGLELAGAGLTAADLTVTPLPPEVTGIVPDSSSVEPPS